MRNNFRYKLFFFLFISSIATSYSNTILRGKAPSYKGETLKFYSFPDIITKRPESLGTCIVDNSGEFQMEFEINSIVLIHIDLGKYDGYVYSEPGKNYELVLPPRNPKTVDDRLNPYFQPQKIHLGVSNVGKKDLNILIQRFDQVFNPFMNEYAVHKYIRKSKETDQFRFLIDSLFSGYDEMYFQNYITYKMALLDFIKYSGGKQSDFYSKFPAKEVDYTNTGFSELFNQVFSRFLYYFSKTTEGAKINEDIFRYRSYEKIHMAVIKSGLFQNDNLVDLIILKGIYDEFFYNDYPKDNLLGILDSIQQVSKIQKDQDIIDNIIWKVTRLNVGKKAPGFQLYDQDGVMANLDAFFGKYVYLNFVSFNSYACQIQFPILSDLAIEFKDSLVVVSICVDETFQEMKDQVENKNYSWPFLHIGNNLELLYEYDVRGYPTYYLLNREGKFLSSPAPSAIENFKNYFNKRILKSD